ncbi:MAG: LytTR family transcriptional regulator [Bacteroidales bacterium]|nr:LytTR family transcriptional regulator [Bacteroidales bacterium]
MNNTMKTNCKPEFNYKPKDILLIKSGKKHCEVVTKSGNYTIAEKIGDLCEKLPADKFVRCHNSYIVNISKITGLNLRSLTYNIEGGFEVPISRSRVKNLPEINTLFG